jgi:predicted HicB family RNase H-like nuclease
MSTLRYKDYQGSVEFEDGHLVVKVLHIDDLVTTTIDSAAKAQAAFQELVDDYVSTCKEVGKEACKPFKGSFNVRVNPELHRQVAMAAAEAGESMNAWIAKALEGWLDRQRSKMVLMNSGFVRRVIHQRPAIRNYDLQPLLGSAGHLHSLQSLAVPPAVQRQLAN